MLGTAMGSGCPRLQCPLLVQGLGEGRSEWVGGLYLSLFPSFLVPFELRGEERESWGGERKGEEGRIKELYKAGGAVEHLV